MAMAFTATMHGADADTVRVQCAMHAQAASGVFAPYMLGSWTYGRTTPAGVAVAEVRAEKQLDLSTRLSWAAGADVVAGYGNTASYMRYDAQSGLWTSHDCGQSPVWIQQLYGTVKWRGVYLTAGMQEYGSELLDDNLSSGDLMHGVNARPVPEGRLGFVDFQDIPLTRGWAQIKGSIAYGKKTDGNFVAERYNRWNSHYTVGEWYTLKRLYFRSMPAQPLCITIGVQAGGLFGGTTTWYWQGQQSRQVKDKVNVRSFWRMLFPFADKTDYYEGSHLGSWDFMARYRLTDTKSVHAYFQWPWEDGSSLALRNKTDGLWGLQYADKSANAILQGVVLEYIDLRDHSGPLHWAPGDRPGTTITTEATGGDNYYNNSSQNPWANYGMSMGTPFAVSPVYNRDGFVQYSHNRTHGVHAAANGSLGRQWQWKVAMSYARAWGSGRFHLNEALTNTSAMAQACWAPAEAWLVKCAVAVDRGTLRGNNLGASATVVYKLSHPIKYNQ